MSSNDIALRVENLGKMYRLGHERPKASGLAGKVKQGLGAPFEWLVSQMRPPSEEETLWALKDVSFEIKRGEVVGFIGHNGAGKSTLLKILSRITEPTEGFAEIHGRIAALLEVGTGMHPELTGRENIYMNGTVLGMKKREIDRKLDEIIDFSGIERFLDTPVKRYSSGMRVRLGFAIAAHLEPEILVVDEVLAVGDAEFQKKCLGKMEDVAKGGRTVLFVSHKMAAVETLCSRACVLNRGTIIDDGATITAIETYMSLLSSTAVGVDIGDNVERSGNGDVVFAGFHLENTNGKTVTRFSSGENLCLVFKLKINAQRANKVDVGFNIHTQYGEVIARLYSSYVNKCWDFEGEQCAVVRCNVRNMLLSPGRYLIKGRIMVNGIESDWLKMPLGSIEMELGEFYGKDTHVEGLASPLLVDGSWE
jgi:lipopolysaccharide transport system ATP-binding protein